MCIRIAQHRGYINNFQKHKEAGKATQPTGEHFNLPGHQGVSDMEVQVIEKVFCKSMAVRLARETWYIQKFQTVSQGINKKT